MTVTAILQQKGSNDVTTIGPDAPLSEAVQTLASRRIGALVVSRDGQKIDGIISERDIVRVLNEQGAACLQKPIASVMTTHVSSCDPADRALDILQRMTEGRFRHMPVMRDGKLAAFISIGDVVKYRMAEIEMERAALEDMVKGF
jgi:CBS domain-containing protein